MNEAFFSSFCLLKKSQTISEHPTRHNAVDISREFAEENNILNNQILYFLLPDSFEIYQFTVHINYNINDKNEIRVPDKINGNNNTIVAMIQPDTFLCKKVKTQNAMYIQEDFISIDKELYTKLEQLSPESIEIRHIATGTTITRKFSSVMCDDELLPGEIRLNFYQREVLNILDSRRSVQSASYISTLCDKIKRTNRTYDRFIDSCDEKQTVKDTYNQIQIVPSVSCHKTRKSIKNVFMICLSAHVKLICRQ